ncbi:MAG: hypothetical protein Q9223_006306 [Gallowayella weberi]
MSLFEERQDFIDITDSGDDDPDFRLEDYLDPQHLQAAVDRSLLPLSTTPETGASPQPTEWNPQITRTRLAAPYDGLLQKVLEVFPDISHDHVKSLYESHSTAALSPDGIPLSENIISQILDVGKYPKERDRQNELKRKRSQFDNSDDERAAKWSIDGERREDDSAPNLNYCRQALVMLQADYPQTPIHFLRNVLYTQRTLYATYLFLDGVEDTYDSTEPRPYYKLKKSRRPKHSEPATPTAMYPTGYGVKELQKELEAARFQRKKLQTQRQIQRDASAAEAAEEKELRDSNQVLECGCCFDEIPINKIAFCNADEPHAVCFTCATTYVNTRIGESRHELFCIVDDGCKATFSRGERRRFLHAKTIEKLERIEQQTWLREANLPNLEECPFCDFAAECPPIEVDKEFRCGNPECQRVSCRKCKVATHIPLSCEEFKKENGLSERHLIEEARSQALLRQCGECKKMVLKERGCNKMTCACGAYICDYCGKTITRESYNHFSDGPTIPNRPGTKGKCPTYDDEYKRNKENMDRAEKEAQEKIRKDNPNVSEEDLKIRMKEIVKSPRSLARELPHAGVFMRNAMPARPPYHVPGAYYAPPILGPQQNPPPPPLPPHDPRFMGRGGFPGRGGISGRGGGYFAPHPRGGVYLAPHPQQGHHHGINGNVGANGFGPRIQDPFMDPFMDPFQGIDADFGFGPDEPNYLDRRRRR